MESTRKVKVTSRTNGIVGLNLPDLRFSRTWNKKDSSIFIDFDILKEGIYDNGFVYMLEQGILEIENKQDRVDLGLEEEDGENFVTILNDNQKLKLLKTDPIEKLEEMMAKLPREQRIELANFAIDHQILNLAKSKVIKKYTDMDIIKAVQIEDMNKEG